MMLNPEGIPMNGGTEAAPDSNAALRFEDLTIDDDLSLLDRVVRYVKSGIALQRLVHVKMVAETARSVGTKSTIKTIIPLLPPLVADSESIIRQHLASQLLPLSLTCMFGHDTTFDPNDRTKERKYSKEGYKIVTSTILNHINTLILDPDMDVRKSSSDALATLALYIMPDDVASMILPIPLRLAHDDKIRTGNRVGLKSNEKGDGGKEDLRITAANLLGDIASLDSKQIPCTLISNYITPSIISLCQDSSFRVRRAAVQALPRVVSGSAADDVHRNLLPCFVTLSEDEMYRVRKSVGECLVDMSRSLMLLAIAGANMSTLRKRRLNVESNSGNPSDEDEEEEVDNEFADFSKSELKEAMMELRRRTLIPICSRLLEDSNKFVRHGMMQFLGPFIASFYPLDGGNIDGTESRGIVKILSGDDNENMIGGMGVQFFPHANGMVNRLNPSNVSNITTIGPSPTPPSPPLDSEEYLRSRLPSFLEKLHNDAQSLLRILDHRNSNPPSSLDVAAVRRHLLTPYVDLATISTGDENIDAEMRVYCAYSLPAVVLLLGKGGWDASLKDCFLALITGERDDTGDSEQETSASLVPLPVKRCLASSFHTVCHILGLQIIKVNSEDRGNKTRDILPIFESHFLRDSDETVRLNVIRNLPSFFSFLNSSRRSIYLPILSEIITGDGLLGASKRRSASNPTLLNWRQRDMVAQILPHLIMIFNPFHVRKYLWPIIKILMADSVNVVKENVEWSIPILFRNFETKNCMKDEGNSKESNLSNTEASTFSAESCGEVLSYLKVALLDNKPSKTTGKVNSGTAFSSRQGYCRILTATALLLRLGGDRRKNNHRKAKHSDVGHSSHPFHKLSSDEYRHIHHVLKNYLLPPAMEMKDDKVTNVRLTLVKSLRVMPPDIRDHGEVKVVLRTLEDEVQTWEGGGGMYMDIETSEDGQSNINSAENQKISHSHPLQSSKDKIGTSSTGQSHAGLLSNPTSENNQFSYGDKISITKRNSLKKGSAIANEKENNKRHMAQGSHDEYERKRAERHIDEDSYSLASI